MYRIYAERIKNPYVERKYYRKKMYENRLSTWDTEKYV